jgi:hypothetical protein
MNLNLHIHKIAEFLTGKFDNFSQAASDPRFIPVEYNNCLVEIVDSSFPQDSLSVFAEQIGNTPKISFNRRRLMQIRPSADRNMVEVAFYTFKHDDRFAGLGDRHSSQHTLLAEDIGEYECSLFFAEDDGIYVGGTPEGGCAHHYQGAETLVIQGTLSSEQLAIWERWYDKNGTQMAGSVIGPYIYRPTARII